MELGSITTIQSSITALLRPLVRMLLRFGVPFGVFSDIAKQVYVDLAMKEFAIPGRKPTVSRASVITGLSRKEVLRVSRLPAISDRQVQDRYNRAVRVISGWTRDKAFTGSDGAPKTLPTEGTAGSFAALVAKYGGDVPMRAVLDELLRVGQVERLEDGQVRLLVPAFVPGGENEDKLAILGTDVADLIATIDHNLSHSEENSRFQLKVAYDNLPSEALQQFQMLSSKGSFDLLRRFDKELAQIDRDANPASQGSGRMRAGIAIYYFEETLAQTDEGGKQ